MDSEAGTTAIPTLIAKSQWLRLELLKLLEGKKKGHIPSSYSCAEIVIALVYGKYLQIDPRDPNRRDRDRLIVSKGHAAMVLYPILADLGFYPKEELLKFTEPDGLLRLYADNSIPGIESITGSLGHGLGIGCGYAYGAKRDGVNCRSFVIVSDGECYEGSVWETAMFAAHHELDNLIAIVDRNGLCILDETEKCVKLDPLEDKWRAFGWETSTINGHSYREILQALDRAVASPTRKPHAIISKSVKGKGIPFMENQAQWHNRIPSEDEIAQARMDLMINCIVE